jgi:hypothetical protein
MPETKKIDKKSLKTDIKIKKGSLKSLLYFIVALLILGGLGWGGYYIYKVYTYKPPSPSPFSLKIKENQSIVNKIESTQDFGQKISTDEPGYGRSDPFAPY